MKTKKIIIVLIIIIVVGTLCYLGIKYCQNKYLQIQKNELEKTIEKYGILEKENIEESISKFNEQIKSNSSLNIAQENYLTIDNKQYWYGLEDGIYCFIIPEKFTGSKNKDIVKIIGIYYEEESNKNEQAIEYVKHLIKANNNISQEAIENLIAQALEKSQENTVAISGEGITLGIYKNHEYTEYQITRLYEF